MLLVDSIPFDPPPPFVPSEYRIKIARDPWELLAYGRLRREVFCDEQGMFDQDDLDEHDRNAIPIVAVSGVCGMPDRVVGTVRIDEREPGLWYGSRLAVDPDCRGIRGLGAGLVRKAVGTAKARGCHTFLATVQRQNVPFFRRLHWRSLEETTIRDRLHHLMQADLAHYPPCHDAISGDSLPRVRAAS